MSGPNSELGVGERKRKIRAFASQFLASSAKYAAKLAGTAYHVFLTYLIASVHNAPPDAPLTLNDDEVAWLLNTGLITKTIGILGSGMISNRFGRKFCMQWLAIPVIVMWFMFYFANSSAMLFSAAALGGFAAGLKKTSGVSYFSEMCEPRLRSVLTIICVYIGIVSMTLCNLIGMFFHWRMICAVAAGANILSFVILIFVPETPYWLISEKRYEDAQKSLCWLRGWTTKEHIQEECNEIMKDMEKEMSADGERKETVNKWRKWIADFNIRNYRKRTFLLPVFLISYNFIVMFLTGGEIMGKFAINIFKTYGCPISAYYANGIRGSTRLVGPVVMLFLVRYTGRRPLVFLSLILSAVLYAIIGSYGRFYLGVTKLDNGAHVKEHFDGKPYLAWLPMVCMISVSFARHLGAKHLFHVLMCESFPANVRGGAVAIDALLTFLTRFITNMTVLKMLSALTLPGFYLMCAVISIATTVLYYFILPETEGWTLTEIQEHFAGERNLVKAGRKRRNKAKLGGNDIIAVSDEKQKI